MILQGSMAKGLSVGLKTHNGEMCIDSSINGAPEGQLVTQRLHWDAVVERHTVAREQTTDD